MDASTRDGDGRPGAERGSSSAKPGSDDAPLRLTVVSGDDGVVVRVGGEVDFASSPVLRQELVRQLESRPALLTVDLADLTFIDSSGLSALIVAWQAAQRQGTALVLDAVPRYFRQILEITGLITVLTVRPAT